MDQELDKWICDKLKIKYRPLDYWNLLYFFIATQYEIGYQKKWPFKCGKLMYEKYRFKGCRRNQILGRYKIHDDGKLITAGHRRKKWYYTGGKSSKEMYITIMGNINKHKLDLKGFKQLFIDDGSRD